MAAQVPFWQLPPQQSALPVQVPPICAQAEPSQTPPVQFSEQQSVAALQAMPDEPQKELTWQL
jgi:hypothetical protein